jgi:hypothetical protein
VLAALMSELPTQGGSEVLEKIVEAGSARRTSGYIASKSRTGTISQERVHRSKDGAVYARGFVRTGNTSNLAFAEQRPRSGELCVRSSRGCSPPLPLVSRSRWATKLLPYARCRGGTRCARAVLLVATRTLSRLDAPPLRILLAVRVLRSLLWFLPAMGLVRHRTSLGLVSW